MNFWHILTEYWPAWTRGAGITLGLSGIAWAIGLLGGIPIAFLVRGRPRWIWVVRASAFLVSTLPALVVLYWAHYPLQGIAHAVWPPFWVAAFSFAIINLVAMANLATEGLSALPRAQVEAAKVLGLRWPRRLAGVELPMLFRIIGAPTLAMQLAILHNSFFAAFISVSELFKTAMNINSKVYQPVEVFSILAFLTFILCFPLNLSYWLVRSRRPSVRLGEERN